MSRSILCYVHAYTGMNRDAGAETTMANLLESLRAAGWNVQVILSRNAGTVTKDGDLPAYTHRGIPVRVESTHNELMELAESADVLISHLECSFRVAIIGKMKRVPVVQLIHNTMWQTEGYLNEGCQLAVFNTEWVKEYHETDRESAVGVAYPQGKDGREGCRIDFKTRRPRGWQSIVLHPQINPALYRCHGPRDYVTMVNMYASKGADTFWRLADYFKDQKFLAVLGGYGEQEIPDEIPANVTVLENTPDTRDFYRHSKVMLMPSKYESFGRVAVEAAASGIPTIASATPGLEEALGPLGTYVRWDDFEGWKTALRTLLNDGRRYAAASENALQRSQHWADTVLPETTEFLAKMEEIAKLSILRR